MVVFCWLPILFKSPVWCCNSCTSFRSLLTKWTMVTNQQSTTRGPLRPPSVPPPQISFWFSDFAVDCGRNCVLLLKWEAKLGPLVNLLRGVGAPVLSRGRALIYLPDIYSALLKVSPWTKRWEITINYSFCNKKTFKHPQCVWALRGHEFAAGNQIAPRGFCTSD